MSLYEITFLTKEESDPGVRALIEEAGGSIQAESSLGRRRLSYPINKETQAVYTTFVFDGASNSIAELDRRLRLNTSVMRHLIVVKEAEKDAKEVSKTVREAIAAADKLEDMTEEPKAAPVAVEAPVETTEAVEEAPVAEEPKAEEVEVEAAPTEEVEVPEEAKAEEVQAPAEEKPARKTRAKKSTDDDAASLTEEDRLKALNDKLGEILKD